MAIASRPPVCPPGAERLRRALDTPADHSLLRQLLADRKPDAAADKARVLAASLDDQERAWLLWAVTDHATNRQDLP